MKLARLAFLGFLFSLIITPVKAEDLSAFVNEMRKCLKADNITLGVLGFADSETRVSLQNRITLRHKVENLLQKADASLKPVAELNRIIERATSQGHFDQTQIRNEIKIANQVDAFVYFEVEHASTTKLSFRLIGISKKSDCQATGNMLEFELDTLPATVDFDRYMSIVIKKLLDKKHIKTVRIKEFSVSDAFTSPCSAALVPRLEKLILTVLQEPDYTIRAKTINLERHNRFAKSSGPQSDSTVIISGKIGQDSKGLWISTRFERQKSHHTLQVIPKTRFSGLDCDPKPMNFNDFIEANARTDPGQLQITAASAKVKKGYGEVNFRIWSARNTLLYCWVIDQNDKTAFLLTPRSANTSNAAIRAGQTKIFPTGFGFNAQKYTAVSENLFGCFAPKSQLLAITRKLWMKKSAAGLLSAGDIVEIMKTMRAEPDIVEAYARVTVTP